MRKITILSIFYITSALCPAATVNVNWDGSGDYTTIQAAIDNANDFDEVVIAVGTYTGVGNRDIDFGGKPLTVRSIDPNYPENCVIDCQDLGRGFHFSSDEGPNSIVDGLTITNGRIIGSSGDRFKYGGGILCEGASPTIKNCRVINNTVGVLDWSKTDTTAHGGGIACISNSNAAIVNCQISGNISSSGMVDSTASGGGIYCSDASPTITNSRIINNRVGTLLDFGEGQLLVYGAGICVASNSNTVIINCQISDNQTVGDFQYGSYRHAYGGGISCADSTIAVYDTVITANKVKGGRKGSYSSISTWGSDSLGGGLYVSASTGSHITNCLVANNETVVAVGDEEWIGPNYGDSRGAGIYCGGSLTISNCTVFGNDTDPTGTGQGGGGGGVYGPATIIDSIIRANLSPSQLSGVTSVMYSDIQGGWGGDGNIDADPLFVTGPALFGDYYLSQTAAGQGANSLCVDAGSDTAANLGMDVLTTAADNALDAGTVDMGYHYNVAVSIADFDNSGRVDLIDLAILASQWQDIPGIPSADIAPNGPDGTVDEDDFDEFSKRWLWN